MNTRHPLRWLAFGLIALALSACVQLDFTVRLEQDERWNGTILVTLDREALQALDEMSDEPIDLTELETDLDTMVSDIEGEYGARGVTASWQTVASDEGTQSYEITVNGQGYDLLNEVLFENSAEITTNPDGSVTIDAYGFDEGLTGDFTGGEEISQEEFDAAVEMFDFQVVFAFEGEEILSASSGTISDDGSRVEWVNDSGPYMATLQPGESPGLKLGFPDLGRITDLTDSGGDEALGGLIAVVIGLCCCGLLLLAIIVVVILLVRRRKQPEEGVVEGVATPVETPD